MSNTLLMLCIPFAGLLLCIAVMPLVKPEWWEKHQAHAVILWSLLFAIPFALFYGAPKAVETVLECLIGDYLTFIVLLFGLFCVAGNIKLEGSLVGNPKVNVIMLAVGTFFFKLYRNYRSQYAFCKADYTDELMEKKQASHHGIFHFSCVKYRRMSYTYRRSAAAHGIFKRSIVFLEYEAVPGSSNKYDTASFHILSFGQEGIPEGYH